MWVGGGVAFDVPGVKENAYFLKDIRDARAIRARILECESAVSSLCFWGLVGRRAR